MQVGQTYYVAVTNYANRNFDVSNPYGREAGSSASDRYYDLYLSFDNGDQNGTGNQLAFNPVRFSVGRVA